MTRLAPTNRFRTKTAHVSLLMTSRVKRRSSTRPVLLYIVVVICSNSGENIIYRKANIKATHSRERELTSWPRRCSPLRISWRTRRLSLGPDHQSTPSSHRPLQQAAPWTAPLQRRDFWHTCSTFIVRMIGVVHGRDNDGWPMAGLGEGGQTQGHRSGKP